MRKLLPLILPVYLLFVCCGENGRQNKEKNEEKTASSSPYPPALLRVFDAHGGLEAWRKKRSMNFQIPGSPSPETHSVDLYSRKVRIESQAYTLGYDGQQLWLAEKAGTYKGDPGFYYNLMFYFHAMPFVFADKGIQFTDTPPLVRDNISYPGFRITYEKGIGNSSEDEYYLHYEPDTFAMVWLGYTVTYGSGKPSDEIHWIRYSTWEEIGGILLPSVLHWFSDAGGTPGQAGDTLRFGNTTLSESPLPANYFARPSAGVFLDRAE